MVRLKDAVTAVDVCGARLSFGLYCAVLCCASKSVFFDALKGCLVVMIFLTFICSSALHYLKNLNVVLR
jgi:hypothetical protein